MEECMRDRLSQAIKVAMKTGNKRRLGTLRLVMAAIKDRDIAAQMEGGGQTEARDQITDAEILALLQKMIKQRRESIATYQQGGRQDLVAQEAEEIAVIEEFLPQQMGETETRDAVAKVVAQLGCTGLKDMGRAMAALKARYAGQMDFAKASALVKDLLK
jgi:uncharacterized protein YqeY